MPKFFFKSKDGGPESNVTGYWLIESKRFFSIVLLRFDKGSREAFHNHAFNSVSWILSGWLQEHVKDDGFKPPVIANVYNLFPSLVPFYTSRSRFHQVHGIAEKSWALSFRGPWAKTWKEWIPKEQKEVVLTNGRIIVEEK